MMNHSRIIKMKIRSRKLNKNEKIEYLDALYTAVESLKSRDEVKNFLRDLLTEGERIMVGRRIVIAKRLLNEESYEQIIREMKVGADTIMRVHRWLEDDVEGYEKAVKKLEKVLESRQEKINRAYVDPFSFQGLKRRYPLHFFLFNLFDELNKEKSKKDD